MLSLTQRLPLSPPPLDDLHQLICSLSDSHKARRLIDFLPSGKDTSQQTDGIGYRRRKTSKVLTSSGSPHSVLSL